MKRLLALMTLTVLVGFSACGGGSSGDKISGAGASFPNPLYSLMFQHYNEETGIEVDYEAIGSGGGIQSILDKTVDFGASDKPVSDSKLAEADGTILHIPTCLGAVVVTYNIPGDPVLKFDSDVIANIFLGNITKWNDPAISDLNEGVDLPDMDIETVHRSDGSGTTFVFTDYLSAVNKEWDSKVGKGKSVVWPVGVGQQQNAGIAGYISGNEGSIGYVELAYAKENGLPVATLKNSSGNFIEPSIESVTLAANTDIPDDTMVSLVDTDAETGYPIATFTWLLLYQEQAYDERTEDEAKAVVDLIWWMTHEAQKYNEELLYAPLPDAAVDKVEAILKSVVYNGNNIK